MFRLVYDASFVKNVLTLSKDRSIGVGIVVRKESIKDEYSIHSTSDRNTEVLKVLRTDKQGVYYQDKEEFRDEDNRRKERTIKVRLSEELNEDLNKFIKKHKPNVENITLNDIVFGKTQGDDKIDKSIIEQYGLSIGRIHR